MVVEPLLSQMRDVVANETERVAVQLERALYWHFKQTEALVNLHALINVRSTLPASREWTCSPDLLQEYVTEIMRLRPSVVLECGSGLSTIWGGYAAELCGTGSRVVALEHDEQYLDNTKKLVTAHGLDAHCEIRLAQLVDVTVDGETLQWYDPSAVSDLVDIGIVLIDGPPGPLGPLARLPAVPLLRPKLAEGAIVIVDDADRADEAQAVSRWTAFWPELGVRRLKHEKGTVVLEAPGRTRGTTTPSP